jgi:hypothetical protein
MSRSHNCKARSAVSKVLFALCITLLIACSSAGTAAAQKTGSPAVQPARPLHIVPMVTAKGKAIQPPLGTHLNYYGGPVISNVNVVTVFWTNKVDSGVQTTLPEFYSAITDSTFYDLLSEYATNVTPTGGGSGTNQSIGRGTTGGTFTIAPSKCNNGTKCTIDDTGIQSELLAQINGGFLPPPELDNNGNVNTLYMIYFPLNVTITLQGSKSCVVFCAYHGTTTSQFNSKNIAYGVFPDMGPSSSCFGGCGSDPDYLKDTTSVSSHELAESATDIEVGIANNIAAPLAWYDPVNGEIGDICNAQQATVTAGGASWTVQKQWSNSLGSCVALGQHPAYQLAAPGSATPGSSFNLTVTAQNPTSGGTMASYIGTVHFTSSDGAAVLPSDYAFNNSDQGSHTFSITLNTNGSQSVTATDTVNSAVTASATITVGTGGSGPLTVSPSSLAFPTTKAGATSAAKTVTVKNTNTAAITVSSVGFTGANPGDFLISSSTCGSSIPASASCQIKVAFAPSTTGARSAALTLTDSATNSPQSVSLTGTATVAVKLTPATIPFAKTVVGQTSVAKTATFKNLLKTSVTLGGISVTGTNAGDFTIASTTCGGSVAALSSCTISLTFTPSATGVRNATLQVLSNAIPSPLTSALAGTGK